jgi:uncharacterized protein YdhG (YjbR/CyaY superfamily)
MSPSKNHFTTIDEYIQSFPPLVQERLHQLRQTIKDVAPNAEEAIKYQMPTFVLHGNLVYFAAWKRHISIYPITAEMEASLQELADYPTSGKGTVQFPFDRPLPLPLIRTIVACRVRENLANKEKASDDMSKGKRQLK